MQNNLSRNKTLFSAIAAAAILCAGISQAEPKHAIAMYGEPALPENYVSLPYTNPDAPQGGKIVQAEGGTFTSLNPHVRKGSVPWQLRFVAYESLMGRSYDEPFTLYGLLAETIDTPDDRSWVEFTLRPEAKFSDGSPVTVEDVMWSYETLGTVGHPRYRGLWSKIETMEQTGPRSVKFTFNVEDRELALIAGMRPILKMAQWEGKDIVEAPLEDIPIASAPYVISDFDPGRYVTLTRNPDYWGNDLNFRRGTNNIDEIRMDFYLDGAIQWEAFKAGDSDLYREGNAEKWETSYDFPRVANGGVTKSVIPHQRPTGITGFVMNTRLDKFADYRVRDALIHAFNFEFINKINTGGRQDRITSYFSNSVLGMEDGPATGKVAELLEPFKANLLPDTLEGYTLPQSDGSERNRKNIRKALALMEDAGWTIQDGVMKNADGQSFTFTVLLQQGATENEAIMNIYTSALKRIGITMDVETLDGAQYKERTNAYNFDMTYYRRGLSLSPGNEQFLYWGADGITNPGTRNWMGMNSPAAEAMIDALVNSDSQDDFRAAARALDRVLMAGRYVIPIHSARVSRIAHNSKLHYPDSLPMYGDFLGFAPDVWWVEE